MDPKSIEQSITEMLIDMHSLDISKQKLAIETYYDKDCRLENPYMILSTRKEIESLFSSLANQNTELAAAIDSIAYDSVQQIATVNLQETINMKALGGLLPIKIHQVIKLQLETSDDVEKGVSLFVTDHKEQHFAQEYISRVPIIGSWYDSTIREAMGKIVLTGSSIIDATGVLNYVPSYVESAIRAAVATRSTVAGVAGEAYAVGHSFIDSTGSRVGQVVGDVTGVGLRIANATGVSSLLSSAGSAVNTVSDAAGNVVVSATDSATILLQFAKQTAFIAKLKAAQYVEGHTGKGVRCYAPTCVPGIRCYSPSCTRNKPEGGFQPQDVVGVLYNSYWTQKKK